MKNMGRIAAVMAALLLAGCPTTGSTPAATATPALAARQVSLPLYTPLYDQAAHLRSLVESGDLAAAAQLVSEQWPYFEANKAKTRAQLSSVAEALNANKAAGLKAASETIDTPLDHNDPGQWAKIKALIATASDRANGYADHVLLKAEEFQSPDFRRLTAGLDALKARLREAAPNAFASFDHFGGRSFFEAYPIEVDSKPLMEKNFASLDAALSRARASQIEQFASTYPRELLGQERWSQLGSRLYAAYANETSRTPGGELRAMLDNLQRVQKVGFSPDAVTTLSMAFVEITSQTLLKEGQIQFPAQIAADLPATLIKAELDDAFKTSNDSAYVVVFDVALAKASRKVTGVRKMPSKFVSGRQTVPNPEYNVVQAELTNARMEVSTARMNQASADSQYCYGIGCIGKAAGQIAAAMALDKSQSNVDAAMAKLKATPMTIEQPIYQDYRYDVANVDARKVMTVNYYVIDRRHASYFKSTFDIEERKKFEVAYRLHANDPSRGTHEASAASEKDVVHWEEAPSTVKLSQLIDHYLANQGSTRKLPAPEQLRSEMLQDKNLALARYKDETFVGSTQADPRFDSVVVVFNPDGALGSGFFVAPDLVLTNYHVVEERDFVELKQHGGVETFGKVVARDVRLDLALIRVQSRGKPVQFFTANKLDLGSTIEVIGHPRGLEFSITRGVVSAVREMQNVNINDSRKVLTVQVDAPISPGNSGGPVFLKDRVVGVVSFARADRNSQNLNFTIHYSEVLRFIKESTNVRS